MLGIYMLWVVGAFFICLLIYQCLFERSALRQQMHIHGSPTGVANKRGLKRLCQTTSRPSTMQRYIPE